MDRISCCRVDPQNIFIYGLTARELLRHTLMIPDLYPALVDDDQDQSEASFEVT